MTNIEVRVRGLYDTLSDTEKRVADYFLKDIDGVFRLPIAQLAEKSGVSQVAWVRFCKSIGFDGLKDMKKSLTDEINVSGEAKPYEFMDIKNFSTTPEIIASVRQKSLRAIEETMEELDAETVSEVAREIVDASCVRIFGVGASGLVAQDLAYKLMRIGKNVMFERDVHLQLTYASNASKNDVAVFISNSGRTAEILELVLLTKKRGCPCISLTRAEKNPLATSSRYNLFTSAPEEDRRSGAMSSRIAQMAVVDALFTAVANQDYFHVENKLERSYQACLNHRRL